MTAAKYPKLHRLRKAMPQVEATPAPLGAVCARHPGMRAVLVCARCGDCCGECCATGVGRCGYCPRCAAEVPHLPGLFVRLGAAFVDYWLTLGILLNNAPKHGVAAATATEARVATLVTALAACVFVAHLVLLALRSQTFGQFLFGVRVVSRDGKVVKLPLLFAGRVLLPLGSMMLAGTLRLGIPVLLLVNYSCMYFCGRRTLVDVITRTVVATRRLVQRAQA